MRHRLIGSGRIVLGLVASAVLGWLAVRGLDWDLVLARLAGASVTLLLSAVAIFMFASYLRAVRWRLLFANDRISSRRLFIIQNEGIGLNNLVPVRVASEVTQLAILNLRDGVSKATAIATLGMERLIDVVASLAILAAAFFLVPELESFKPYVWGGIAATITALVALRVMAWGTGSIGFVRRISAFVAFARAFKSIEQERARLLASLVVSIAYWILVGITAWVVAMAIDLPMSPVTATLVIMAVIFFATVVPAAPSALGTFEWAVVSVLAFFGIEHAAGFGFAVIIHAVFFLPPTIIAIVFLPREGVLPFRRKHRLSAASAGPDGGNRV